jgi:hypothetical protein
MLLVRLRLRHDPPLVEGLGADVGVLGQQAAADGAQHPALLGRRGARHAQQPQVLLLLQQLAGRLARSPGR